MKASRKVLIFTEGMTLILILAACNLPIGSATPFVFPTVDLTQTLVINPTIPPPVTETPAILATATYPIIKYYGSTKRHGFTTDGDCHLILTTIGYQLPPNKYTSPPDPNPTGCPQRPTGRGAIPECSSCHRWSWTDLPSSSEKPANIQVYRNPAYTGSAKPGMSFRIAWDNQYLYIGVKVADQNYNQSSTGENIYKGDSVEVLIDTNVNGDFYSHALTADDYQLGISPGYVHLGRNPEAYLWFPAAKAGSRSDVKIAAINPSAGLYRIEFAIPWNMFGITPSAGMHLGFVISYSDDATNSKAEQDLMVSNDPYRVLTDPTTWGDLTLIP